MKFLLKKTPIIFLLLTITLIGASCDNDSSPSPNDNQCNYSGLTWVDTTNNINTEISDADLNTQFFPNASNGPYGAPGIEIAGTTTSGEFIHFATNVIIEGATGTGYVTIAGSEQTVTVTCQRTTGTQIGDEYRYDVVLSSNAEMEFCVTIDEIL